MNIGLSYINLLDAATLTPSSEHLSFPASNVQHRWFVKPWRSKYGAGSDWGRFIVSAANQVLSFNEGGGVLTATLVTGTYDTATLCAQIKTQMEAAGALTYTVTYSDTTNLFTIAGSGAFVLTLSVTANSAFPMLGWTAVINTASLASHTAPAIRIHTSESLAFDLGAAHNLYWIAIKNHNLQAGATIQVLFYSDAWVTLAETETLTWKAGLIVGTLNQYYRYVAIRIVDVDNPDLYIEIGRPWLGVLVRPRWGFTAERTLVPNDPSVIAESENGQASSIQRTKYDAWDYNFDGIDPDDKVDLDAIHAEVGSSKALFICEDPDLADMTPVTKYVTISSWEWEHVATVTSGRSWWKLAMGIKEER
jgi:hypothetical protein